MDTYIVQLIVQILPVLACVDLRVDFIDDLRLNRRGLPVTVLVISNTSRPTRDALLALARMQGRQGRTGHLQQLRELQRQRPPFSAWHEASGEERRMQGRWRRWEQGLLLGGAGVRAADPKTSASAHPQASWGSAQAVPTWPATPHALPGGPPPVMVQRGSSGALLTQVQLVPNTYASLHLIYKIVMLQIERRAMVESAYPFSTKIWGVFI